MIGATGMLPHEQHRLRPRRHREWTQQRKADPEFPVLAVSEAGEEPAGCLHGGAAEQQMPAIGEQVAHQQPFQDVAALGQKRVARSDERAGAGGGNRVGGCLESRGEAEQRIRCQPVVGVEEEQGVAPPPNPLPKGE